MIMSSIDDVLFDDSPYCYQFGPAPKTYLEVWTFEGSDQPLLREGEFRDDDLHPWMNQEGIFAPPVEHDGHPVNGGLRLICYSRTLETHWHIPFTAQEAFSLLDHLDLPRSWVNYPTNEGLCLVTPPDQYLRNHTKGVGFGISTPAVDDMSSCALLSWNPRSCVTSGYLSYDKSAHGVLLINQLRRLGSQARLPGTSMFLLLKLWVDDLQSVKDVTRNTVLDVRLKLGTLERHYGRPIFEDRPDDPTILHKTLMTAFERCYDVRKIFIRLLMGALVSCIEGLFQTQHFHDNTSLQVDSWELRLQFSQLRAVIASIDADFDKILANIDFCQRVLYNNMQQEDNKISRSIALDSKKLAEASTRDSSSMKAIAVLTMVFLPSTAVATIFSMGPFWTNEPGSVPSVSSEFWLYWAVTLPLTTVVLMVWQTWLWIYQKRQRRSLKDIEEAAAPISKELVTQENRSLEHPAQPMSPFHRHRTRSSNPSQRVSIHQHLGSFPSVHSAKLQPQASRCSSTSNNSQPSIPSQASQHSRKTQ